MENNNIYFSELLYKLPDMPEKAFRAVTVKQLVKKGANPNYVINNEGETILMNFVADSEKYGYAIALVRNGASVNLTNNKGENALMYAAKNNVLEIVKFLVKKGININAQNNDGDNALSYLIHKNNNINFIKKLIKRGININSKNKIGNSVLFKAVNQGTFEIVKLLLENGADINAGNEEILLSINPYSDNYKKKIKLLRKSGAKISSFLIKYRLETKCEKCNNIILLDKPAQKILCKSCNTHIDLDKFWEKIFNKSRSTTKTKKLYCSNIRCNAELDISKYNFGSKEPVICSKCGKENRSEPAPEWMKRYTVFNNRPLQIFCEEKENDDKLEKAKSVSINCVSCGASLIISKETPRVSLCKYCETKQYLTDEIWGKLHPAKKMETWYIYFNELEL